MFKVLHIVNSMNQGGAEIMIMNIFRNIDKNKFIFDFFVEYKGENYFENEIRNLGGNLFKAESNKGCNLIKYTLDLWNVLKNGNYDAVHVHASNSSAFVPLMISKYAKIEKRIVHAHNTLGISRIRQRIQKQFLLHYATKLLSCGKDASKWMYGSMYEKAQIINLPIDCKKMFFDLNKREIIRKKWNLTNKMVFGTIGRMDTQKNPLYLIELFAKIHKKNQNSVLIYVGDGNLRDSVMQKIQDEEINEEVIIIPSISDAGEILSGLDAFLLPSLYEGFPTVAIEAQANGLQTFLSSTITNDIKLTDLVLFIDITLNPILNASIILKNMDGRKRSNFEQYNQEIALNYSASKVTDVMEGIYLE